MSTDAHFHEKLSYRAPSCFWLIGVIESAMNFVSANPSIVRSIRQRAMLNAWLRLYAQLQEPPQFENFKLNRLSDELDEIVFYLVEASGDAVKFLIENDGRRTYQA